VTDTETPADTIRRAATHLRTLATAADAPPWTLRPVFGSDPDGASYVETGDGTRLARGGSAGTRGRYPHLSGADARYVTAMDPAAGLALADLLDAHADTGDATVLTVARHILGGAR